VRGSIASPHCAGFAACMQLEAIAAGVPVVRVCGIVSATALHW
jgi:hypothetical protein